MTARALDVFMNDRQVGRLREDNDVWAFDYEPAWADATDGFDLSPALPRKQLAHLDGASNRPVQWYFDNLLPEEALRTVLAREANVHEDDAFGLLAWYGAESAGSLVLRDPAQPAPAATGLRPLPDGLLAARIRNLPRLPLNHGAPKHMSLAGAQHKLAVVYRDGALYEPLPGDVSTHILKPDHQGGAYPASVINEYFVMRLAGMLGLTVPGVHRHYCPDPVYLVDRFDRTFAGNRIVRLHMIDACQLMNKARSFKYRSATVETLREVIEYVRVKPQARLALYRWLVFNVLVGNGDNHLKNISFMVSSDGIEIAPCYDLLSTAVYATTAIAGDGGAWPHVPLVLPLPGAAHFSEVTRTSMLEAGMALGLGKATVQRELDLMVRKIDAQAATLYDAIGEENARLPAEVHATVAGEMRLLRSILHVVIPDMLARL